MTPAGMTLRIFVPSEILAEKIGVTRIVVETLAGSFGLLPHRLDCVAALRPGILTYQTETEGSVYVAVDEGVLAKTGLDVRVSVRRARGGVDLGELRAAVERDYVKLNESQRQLRNVMAQLEAGVLRRFGSLHGE